MRVVDTMLTVDEAAVPPIEAVSRQLRILLAQPAFSLPLPGSGQTLDRWRALSLVASHDLSLAKLYEGHTDALAILDELGDRTSVPASLWGVWAAEAPAARVILTPVEGTDAASNAATLSGASATVRLDGNKAWCSGARVLSHALVTTWKADGSGPYLVKIGLAQRGVEIRHGSWQAIGMAASESVEVRFAGALGELVGGCGAYVDRPGFMQGGAGIAACWFGGASALAAALRRSLRLSADRERSTFRLVALGACNVALAQTAALLRQTAGWIDAHPRADASAAAWRVRHSADTCAREVLDVVGRALGATPFCKDAAFARMAADLPVFTRQCLAERDLMHLGERLAAGEPAHAEL